jgi:hypothetical protein
MWRVYTYDSTGKLLCYENVATQAKAERVAVDVTRYAKVKTRVAEVQHNEASL